ncbi:MAG: hypothetical protein NVSMB55_27250 [Mycobacteriales bacterium]
MTDRMFSVRHTGRKWRHPQVRVRLKKGGVMRLRTAGLLSVALLGAAMTPSFAATTAPAAKSNVNGGWRVSAESYRGPAGANTTLSGTPGAVLNPGPWQQLRNRENRFSVAVADQSGQPVLTEVEYTPTGAHAPVSMTTCSPSLTMDVAPGSRVRAEALAGRCTDGSVSTPTVGSMTFRFYAPPVVSIAAPSQRWAALVGLRSYQRPTHDTVGGAGDTTAVLGALLNSGWRRDHILVVTDGAGTPAGIEGAMHWLVAHSTPSTFSLFHYSGHICIASRGPCGAGHTWLWTTDNQFVSENTVAQDLSGLRGHAWLDFAGCEAGAFDVGLHSADRLFTASSQPHETSYEQPSWGESEWAGLLWDRGYDQGQANGQPYTANVGAMTHFAADQATADTANQPAGAQHPYIAGGQPGWRLSAPPG